MTEIKSMKISDIELDDDLYPRQHVYDERIAELQRVKEAGEDFGPLAVCHITNRDKPVLVDGAHRREVLLRLGLNECQVEDLGTLTKKDALIEAFKRNSTGPLQITLSDRKLTAAKMVKLGVSESEASALCHLERILVHDLANITYQYQGEMKILPRVLTRKENNHIIPTITVQEMKQNSQVIVRLNRNFSAKQAMKSLNTLLDYEWLQVDDPEVIRQAKKLYQKLQTFFTEKEKEEGN